jgi:hypothetical protein
LRRWRGSWGIDGYKSIHLAHNIPPHMRRRVTADAIGELHRRLISSLATSKLLESIFRDESRDIRLQKQITG